MLNDKKRTVLVLDDDEINLMILTKGAEDAGYGVKSFLSSEEAWEYLQQNPDAVDISLIDKMMPGMSGTELLRRMKEVEALRHIPVILQTGDVGVAQMRECLEAGAYYYLTKPFHPEILAALLHSAANECATREEIYGKLIAGGQVALMMEKGTFRLKTHEQARYLSAFLSQRAAQQEFAAMGLMELLSNAIEHGNLGIGYDAKRRFLVEERWREELAARAADPLLSQNEVSVFYERTASGLYVIITDSGAGFDWREMVDDEAMLRINAPNGRGIARAMLMLDDVRFVGNGREVHCSIRYDMQQQPEGKRTAPELVWSEPRQAARFQ